MDKSSRKSQWLWILIFELSLALVTAVITAIAVYHITDSNYMWLNGMLWFLICSAVGDFVIFATASLSMRLRAICITMAGGLSALTIIGSCAAYQPGASTFYVQYVTIFASVIAALFILTGIIVAACMKRAAYRPCLLVKNGVETEDKPIKTINLAQSSDTFDLTVENANETVYFSGCRMNKHVREIDEVRLDAGETFVLTVDKNAAELGLAVVVKDKFRDDFFIGLSCQDGKYFLTR